MNVTRHDDRTGKYFQGEALRCAKCGAVDPGSSDRVSGWRVLEADGTPYYFCPDHFPAEGASQKAFEAAYRRCLTTINELRDVQLNLNILAALRRLDLSGTATLRALASGTILEKYPRAYRDRLSRRAYFAGLHAQPAEVEAIVSRVTQAGNFQGRQQKGGSSAGPD